jgi:hypothetical protein
MIVYTFLLPGKNDLCKAHFPHPRYLLEKPVAWSPLAGGNIPEREAHPEVAIDKKKPLKNDSQGLLLMSFTRQSG